MRVIAEIPHPQIKITVFAWNAKYIIKLEAGPYEQIYKVKETDVTGLEQVKELINDEFIEQCINRFVQMRNDFSKQFSKITN